MDVESFLSTIPTPSVEYMQSRRVYAKEYTVVFLRHVKPGVVSGDEQLHIEHLRHLTKLQILGKLVLNGPVMTDHEIAGISIYAAGVEEARALAEADPKVKAGVFFVEAIPWMAVPSEKI